MLIVLLDNTIYWLGIENSFDNVVKGQNIYLPICTPRGNS